LREGKTAGRLGSWKARRYWKDFGEKDIHLWWHFSHYWKNTINEPVSKWIGKYRCSEMKPANVL
jgi:hypothetical protein